MQQGLHALINSQSQAHELANTNTNTNTNTEIASCLAKSMTLASLPAKSKKKEKRIAIPTRIPSKLVKEMARITVKQHGSIRGESPGNLSLMYEEAISQFIDRTRNKQQHATLTTSFKPMAKIKGDKLTRLRVIANTLYQQELAYYARDESQDYYGDFRPKFWFKKQIEDFIIDTARIKDPRTIANYLHIIVHGCKVATNSVPGSNMGNSWNLQPFYDRFVHGDLAPKSTRKNRRISDF